MVQARTDLNNVADNSIIFNGEEFIVTDAVAIKVLQLLRNGLSEEVKWDIVETTDVVSGKKFFVIYSSVHGTLKKVANQFVKDLKDITTIRVAGKNGTYNAWGFKTKKEAEEAIKSLPERIEA